MPAATVPTTLRDAPTSSTVTRCLVARRRSRSGCSGRSRWPSSGRPIVVDTRKALAIVALVAAEGRPFARDELAAMFWPEADDEAARGRAPADAVGAPDGGRRRRPRHRPGAGRAGSGGVVGRPGRARAPAPPRPAGRPRGRRRARPRPVPGRLRPARQPRLRRLAGGSRRPRRADRRRRSSSGWPTRASRPATPAGAVEAARRRVELDPLDEVGQRRLIELLAQAGDRAGAIRQYRELVALFDRELGVAPLRETTDLYDAIREGGSARRPPATAAGSPAAGRSRRRSRRPASIPLVGRATRARGHRIGLAGRQPGRSGRPRSKARRGSARPGSPRRSRPRSAPTAGSSSAPAATRARGAIAYGPIAELAPRRPRDAGRDRAARDARRDRPARDRPPGRPAGVASRGRRRPAGRRPTVPAPGSGCSMRSRASHGARRPGRSRARLGRRPPPRRRLDPRGARLPRPPPGRSIRSCSCWPGAART